MLAVVVGGGVVGSWIALKLSEANYDVFLLDKEPALWYHTSTRNSGVIHAGIYYEYHSLKRIFSIAGARKSYEFFKKYNVEHRISGKIIVGFNEEDRKTLKILKENGDFNGVKELSLIDKSAIKKLEPYCKADFALYSPYTGVVNCSDYYKKMEALLQEKKVNIVTNCEVLKIFQNKVETNRGELEFDILINAAGLHSDNIAKMCGVEGFEIKPYKGEYYSLNENSVNSMIYPTPGQKGHLGIHLTKTAYNEIWIGPTSKQVENKEDYNVLESKDIFLKACERLLTHFKESKISEGFAGVRAKCFHNNFLLNDFLIFRKSNKIHLIGIDSPGLTSAPSIAEYILKLIA